MWVVIVFVDDISFRTLVIIRGVGEVGNTPIDRKGKPQAPVIPHNEWDFTVTSV
jgi:hypothetical protein